MSELNYMRPIHRKISIREIWIMLGILLVLIAVVSTIFLKQSQDSLRVAGSRNLQQWGIALNLFLIDNDNQLPAVGFTPVSVEQTQAWYNSLPPYIARAPLASLPPEERPRPGLPSLWISPASKPVKIWDSSQFYFEYGMNKALQPDLETRSFKISELEAPARVVMLAPIQGYSPESTPEQVVFRYGDRPQSPSATTFVLFCDGHVEPVTRSVLVEDPASRLAKTAADGKLSWFEN